jgi:hypothetical protein
MVTDNLKTWPVAFFYWPGEDVQRVREGGDDGSDGTNGSPGR